MIGVSSRVTYWGSEKRDGPRNLHEMFDRVPRELLQHIPDYKVILFAPRECEKLDTFATELGAVMQLIAVSYDKDKLQDLVHSKKDVYENLPIEEVRLVNQFTSLKVRKTRGKETGNVCKGVEDLRKEAMAEGMEKGMEKGLEKGKAEGKAEERTAGIRILAETLKEIGLASSVIAQKVQEKYGPSAKDIAML